MKRLTTLAAGALMLMGTAAYADCAAEIAALEGGISKDGTLAPLGAGGTATPQTPPDGSGPVPEAAAPAEGEGEAIAKDGSTEPLGASPDVATSAQDAQAQQEGGMTAAEQAGGAEGGMEGGAADPKAAALERAKAALAEGDEDACMSAIEAAM